MKRIKVKIKFDKHNKWDVLGSVNSDYIKLVVASFFRYNRQYSYVCTEFVKRDIFVANKDESIEIETKISKSDLKREINKPKHKSYKTQHCTKIGKPNYYYIAIPDDMLDDSVVSFIESLNPKYGIILVYSNLELAIYKRAELLYRNKPNEYTLRMALKRMSSEILTLKRKLLNLEHKKKT